MFISKCNRADEEPVSGPQRSGVERRCRVGSLSTRSQSSHWILLFLSFAQHYVFRCPTVVGGSRAWLLAGGPCTRIFNIKRGSAFCKAAVHRQFNGHVRVRGSNRFSLGTPQRSEGQKSTQKSQTMRTAGLRPFVDAVKQTKANDRVTKIKHAIQVLGDTEGLRAARPSTRK